MYKDTEQMVYRKHGPYIKVLPSCPYVRGKQDETRKYIEMEITPVSEPRKSSKLQHQYQQLSLIIILSKVVMSPEGSCVKLISTISDD